ncbi:hypothetical protein [Priestia koreensis]|uniref:Lipoprotein n=1 Tax=Priestia koreensis TaxID=284581 RepID=A0A0M0KNX5_9BACI|nr:hypothetical protein [Priestia koreensis]KOO40322.1 hypothetical protein AMD01_21470 [Priestia koreensis]
MKKFGFLLLITLLATSLVACQKGKDYPEGKDTVESYQNGRYQILKVTDTVTQSLGLVDLKTSETITFPISSYLKEKSIVLVKGPNEFVIIDIKTNKLKKYSTPNKIPEKYQSIFKKMK